ncbi:MAG: hypothetical protein GY796_19755 [Chloroflexi bacterium]|nr:hypothetical protein [Chloroflexota bacterium]
MDKKIVMYGSPVCPMVGPVRGILQRAGAEFVYVDIYKDDDGRQTVRNINNGNESVPTLVFPDESTLTEPSGSQLKGKLEAMGYTVRKPKPWEAVRERPLLMILAMLALLFALWDGNGIFLVISVVLLGVIFVGSWLLS